MRYPVKPADDVGITPELASLLGENKTTPEWKQILEIAAKLRENRLAGESIRKSQIRYYIEKYDVTYLYRYELSKTMRAYYTLQTIEHGRPEIIAMILEVFWDHKSYDRRFGYTD